MRAQYITLHEIGRMSRQELMDSFLELQKEYKELNDQYIFLLSSVEDMIEIYENNKIKNKNV